MDIDLTIYCSACNGDIGEKDEVHCVTCVEKLNDEIDDLKKENDDLKAETETLESQNSDLEDQITQLKNELDHANIERY